MFARTVFPSLQSRYIAPMTHRFTTPALQILTAMIFIACWTLQVCAQPLTPQAPEPVNAHAHHQMSGHAHHGAPGEQAEPECEENALCGAPLLLNDLPQLDLPAILPEAPKPDLKALRQTAAKAPVFDPLHPIPPPWPTPVQLFIVQLN